MYNVSWQEQGVSVGEQFDTSLQIPSGCHGKASLKDHLTLRPTAVKRHPHHGIGCPRPQATTIVAGVYAHRRVLSLVTAYEVCVCEWLDQRRGTLKTFHLH